MFEKYAKTAFFKVYILFFVKNSVHGRYYGCSVSDQKALQSLVNIHENLLILKIGEYGFTPQNRPQKLKDYVTARLRSQYDKLYFLLESHMFFMGDGRTGKTSTLRNLCDKPFSKIMESTILLEDSNIFQVGGRNDVFKPIKKHEWTNQRVKNVGSFYYSSDCEEVEEPKYKLDFEKELIERIISDEDFSLYFRRQNARFKHFGGFCRVYDFGGQEIFSSVHHIFMTPSGLYVVVFKMIKTTEKDIDRLRYWCESVIRNAPNASIMFVGTYFNKFLTKNELTLEDLEKKLKSLISSLSQNLNIIMNSGSIFFPIENSKRGKQLRVLRTTVRVRLSDPVEGAWKSSLPRIWILFLDNCREEKNFMTLKSFRQKVKECKLDKNSTEKMLEIYSNEGILLFFPSLELNEEENFIFFEPSYLAQALGKFIRDPSFHQLAFQVPKKYFPLYRDYVNTGKITKKLINVLLKKYSIKERNYIITLALRHLVLLKYGDVNDVYLIPELLPELGNSTIKPEFKQNIKLISYYPTTFSLFGCILLYFVRLKDVTESYLYKGFGRFIFNSEKIVDVFQVKDKIIGFQMFGRLDLPWLNHVVNDIQIKLLK
eukprot:snap_masked-scaffold_28-processed-gene-2.29-mRNA-1 protein AED:1.00 eAED:1.00 QI:0/0/0/0/1/1/2/0/598